MNNQDVFLHSPAIPYEGDCVKFYKRGPIVVPFEFTGWRDETMAWKESAYLGANLNPAPTYKIEKGPMLLNSCRTPMSTASKTSPSARASTA